ncbi:MAG: SUMF1/EgtB/PvdO family nonheme iron enzyme [Anaerolineae bacterium]|nr:SUMF1/EgtB/PvdO family nonheme iron enzyme [Anaerolineae bacterium]
MVNDYGSLRRRTRDSSWQWLIVGVILGMGFTTVVCVGGYALGAITFPALESDTATPIVQVEPNQTESANQAAPTGKTPAAAEVAPDSTQPTGAAPETESAAAEQTAINAATATPSPLPESVETQAIDAEDSETRTADALAEQTSTTEGEAAVAALPEETTIVGTPPVGLPTQTITFGSPPQLLPPELDAIKSELAPVTGGTFLMGTTTEEASQAIDECALYDTTCPIEWVQDSTPTHQVTVDSFEMEIYEVSVVQYVAFLNWKGPNSHKNACQGQPCVMTTTEQETSYIDFDGTTYSVRNPEFYSNHPITWVTWQGAEEYCNALNRRLPTEAEWERAARGPQNNVYPWGFIFDVAYANSSRPAAEGTEAVTSYPEGASPYGIYNMSGNVAEWVSDWYQANYYSQQLNNLEPNPQGPPTGTEKVLRGGSWDTVPLLLRAVHRQNVEPGLPTAATGFRCVASSTTAAAPSGPIADTAADEGDGGAAPDSNVPTLAPPPTQVPAGPTTTLAPG